jgi:hypothetical protein
MAALEFGGALQGLEAVNLMREMTVNISSPSQQLKKESAPAATGNRRCEKQSLGIDKAHNVILPLPF